MRIAGRIIKTELKERVEDEIPYECVIVTVEIERMGFKAKVQEIIDAAAAHEWQLGGSAWVDTQLAQSTMRFTDATVGPRLPQEPLPIDTTSAVTVGR